MPQIRLAAPYAALPRFAPLLLAWLVTPACTSGGQTGDEWVGSTRELRSSKERVVAAGSPENTASSDEQAFAWKLYTTGADPEANTVFSPLSVSLAGAMLVAGAAGDTKTELQAALNFTTEGNAFHAAQNTLLQALAARNHATEDSKFLQTLSLSNDVWVQAGAEPKPSYLDTLAAYYGAGLQQAQFETEPEESREAINQKVGDDTHKLIPELLAPRTIESATRVVLTNALYFKGLWAKPFLAKALTTDEPFYAADTELQVPMMHGLIDVRYAVTDAYQAVAIPLEKGELEWVAVMPTAGTFNSFASALDASQADTVLSSLNRAKAILKVPRFSLASSWDIQAQLKALGVVSAFDEVRADFSPMSTEGLHVSHFLHQASFSIDEKGLEAAAATAVVLDTISGQADPPTLTFDHPFVFFVRDVESGANLFVGHYVKPE